MMKMLDTTATLYAPAKANALAATLQAGDDDGWTYTAIHDPKGTGYSSIAIYDDDGAFISTY
jgi:hypothetical protein